MARIAEHLSKKYQVTVLTSLPSYPTGILPKEYQGKLWDTQFENNVRIIRIWDLPTANKGFIKRSLNHIVFCLAAAIGVSAMEQYDLVIVSSPSFLSVLAGILAAKVGKGKFIFDVRDLWPDSAFELGYKVNPFIRWSLKTLEKYFYRKSNKIFTATEEIKKTIINMHIPSNKVVTLVNTVDIDVFKPIKVSRVKLNIDIDDFAIVYVGSLTQVQNLGTVLQAAETLKKYPKIKFLLIGEGEDKDNLIARAKKLKLTNVRFIDGQPTEKIIEYMNAANVGLISLSTNKFFSDNALPTKTSEYLGCGRPIVACAGKTLKELIETNKVGQVVSPGDSKMLSETILKLYQNPKLVQEYSKNARRLATEKFSDQKFYQILDENLT
ncbi:MAG: hypothetical protein HW405_258 [Candidatus Berkelbacteria bacterium]|nr:hypothetical protein [Candidatus Berkelbacteria bacterium]